MRIVLALGGSVPRRSAETPARRRELKLAAAAVAEVADRHEVVLTHAAAGAVGHPLELALRNELPERDVVTVLTQVVVAAGDRSPEPQAIAEIRSLRALVDSGALVLCAAGGVPVSLDGTGTLRRAESAVDADLTAALLARRLDADLLVMVTDDAGGDGEGPQIDAARRFAAASGRHAAIGPLGDAARIVRGEAGTQVAPGDGRPAGAPLRSRG